MSTGQLNEDLASVGAAVAAGAAQCQAATIRAEADEWISQYTTDHDNSTKRYVADRQLDGTKYASTADLQGKQYASDKGLIGTEYSADKSVEATEIHEAGETNRLNMKLSFADAKFKEVWPWITQWLSSKDWGSGETTFPNWPPVGDAPILEATGVWTPQETQQQINLIYTRNDARAQNDIRKAQIDLAGRGFSSNSPLLDALTCHYEGHALQASSTEAVDLRVKVAAANDETILKAQTLQVNLYNVNLQAFAEVLKAMVTQTVGTLQATATMVAGVV